MKARSFRRQAPVEPGCAEIRSAIGYMLYVVDTYGDRYLPILESLIADLDALELRESPRERARRIMAAYTLDGGLKAIR